MIEPRNGFLPTGDDSAIALSHVVRIARITQAPLMVSIWLEQGSAVMTEGPYALMWLRWAGLARDEQTKKEQP